MGTSLYEQFEREQQEKPAGDLYEEFLKETASAKPARLPVQADATSRRAPGTGRSGDFEVIGRGIAANALSAAQVIPGMEPFQAAMGALGSKFTDNPLSYRESYNALKDETDAIPGPIKLAGQLPMAARMLPQSLFKSIPKAMASGGAVGAAHGLAQGDPEAGVGERVKDAAVGGSIGAAVPALVGGGIKAVDKGREMVGNLQRIRKAPTLGETALTLDDEIEQATRANYTQAAAEGEASGGTSPGLAKALEHPRVKKFVELVRDGEEGSPTSDAETAREVYKLMSKQRRGLKSQMDVNGYDAAKDREIQKLGSAMKQLKEATAAVSEKPPITLDIAGERTVVDPKITAGREAMSGPVRNGPLADLTQAPSDPTLRQALRDFPESALPPKMQGPAGPGFQLRGQPDKVVPGVEIETPAMRIQTAPAEEVAPVMPSFPKAVAEKARMEGEREAFHEGADATRRVLRGTSLQGKKALKQSPEAFLQRDIPGMTPGEAEKATLGTLGRAKESLNFKQSGPSHTAWGAIQSLAKPAATLHRVNPLLEALDKAAGKAPRQTIEIERILRAMGILNAPLANSP